MDEFEDFPDLLDIANIVQAEADRGNAVRRIVVHRQDLWSKLVAVWANIDWQGVRVGSLGCTWLGVQWGFEASAAQDSFSVIVDGRE